MGPDIGSLALDMTHSANTSSNISFMPVLVGGAGDTAMIVMVLALPSWGSQSTGETHESLHSDIPEWARLGWGSLELVLGLFQGRIWRASWRRGPPTGMWGGNFI